MIFSKRYFLLAYTILKLPARQLKPIFETVKGDLKKSEMRASLEEYMSSYLLTNIIALPSIALLTLIYIAAFTRTTASGTVAYMLLSAFIGFIGILLLYLIYPSYVVGNLKSELDKNIAFASTHMATIAGTGIPPHLIFQMMGQFDEYGPVATACQRIYRNIAIFGYDTLTALSEEAQKTPSHKFKDILWSIVATIRTGGDLRAMLMSKSKALMEEQRRIEARYIETLSMLAEVYSTVFVAGTVMIFVLVAIMGILGGLPVPVELLLEVSTYFAIPIGSVGFIIVIETSKPSGG